MDITAWAVGAISQIVGAVLVGITLIYLAVQLRQKIVFEDERSTWQRYAQEVRPISKNPMPRLTINFNSHDLLRHC
jgi:hypothetical protein